MARVSWRAAQAALALVAGAGGFPGGLRAQPALADTAPLTAGGDLSARMIEGIGRFLRQETERARAQRGDHWHPDLSGDRAAYEKSVAPNRTRLLAMIGAIDPRMPGTEPAYVATTAQPALVAETERLTIHAVRWPVLEGVHAEGLLLRPRGRVTACLVAVPDADETPEAIAGIGGAGSATPAYARRLAENGCLVLIPTLADRSDAESGSAVLGKWTNQPHREWIYRQSFVLGRHAIGYEVQMILAAVDWLARTDPVARPAIGVAGWGEGGLLALYAAAVDTRIDAALVSGYFGPREELWREPIYRNLFGLLREFGDAEIARLIAPRQLLIEPAAPPPVDGPPPVRPGRMGAAPGRLVPPALAAVQAEVDRARRLAGPFASSIRLLPAEPAATIPRFGAATLLAFLQALRRDQVDLQPPGPRLTDARAGFDPAARQARKVRELEHYTQQLLRRAPDSRDEFFWKHTSPTTPEAWREAMRPFREKLWRDHIGHFPTGKIPLNPRSRPLYDRPTWTGYEVVLDVLPEVYAWGYFLVPKGLRPGERRPAVVVQHGVKGLPADVMNEDPAARANATYQAFAVRLAERGFVVFAPHNPYRGDDASRVLQRQAQPLGQTIFAIIAAQHDRVLDWLSSRPEVDADRIGFYGLSYGGQTAMRVPVLLERYAVTICSGDFNEWTVKNVTTDWPWGYIFRDAYERPEFNMGNTFGYGELAALIAPRPFMVERGHNDGVAIDEWVAFEYAKVRRLYAKLKIPDRTEIEFFDGPHTIHGVGTYRFLHRHLGWPEPGAVRTNP